MESLTNEQRDDIDVHILTTGYIPSIIRIRTICGNSLNEAKQLFWERYNHLRGERNPDFTRSDEDYCSGILE